MPGLLDRPKLTQAMAAALKHHILKERERKRQEEEEADKAIERKREEAERLRKKAEAESLSLEETKEQIKSMEEKLKSLQADKHDLFLQLKKVLNEDENRRRQQMKEKSELMVAMSHHQYHPAMHMPGPHMIVQGAHMASRPAMLNKNHMYRAAQQAAQNVHGVKRARSPSPPVVELYPQHPVQQGPYAQGPYGQSQASHGSYRQGHQPYTTSQANSSYQSATGYPPSQQAAVHAGYAGSSQSGTSKYQSRESAFSSYPNHYVPQQAPQAYQAQTHRYIHSGQPATAASIAAVHQQQTVDQSVKQGPYGDDQGHYQHKLQGQHVRPIGSAHPQALHAQQALLTQSQVHLQAQQGKPSMSSTYAQRRKPESPIYPHKKPTQPHQQSQPQPHGSNYQSSQQGQRHGSYSSQSQHQQGASRYYSGM